MGEEVGDEGQGSRSCLVCHKGTGMCQNPRHPFHRLEREPTVWSWKAEGCAWVVGVRGVRGDGVYETSSLHGAGARPGRRDARNCIPVPAAEVLCQSAHTPALSESLPSHLAKGRMARVTPFSKQPLEPTEHPPLVGPPENPALRHFLTLALFLPA